MDVFVGIKVFVGIAVLVGGEPVVIIETGVEVLLAVAVLTGVTLATDMFDPVDGDCPLGLFVTPVMGTNATVPVVGTVIVLDAITIRVIVREAVAVGVGVGVNPSALTISRRISNL
jgi:hypothetical protein